MHSIRQKIVLDFDDSTIYFVNWDKLFRLKKRYPQLKVSFFHIPFDYPNEKSLQRILRTNGLKKLKENLDWIQLIPHGVAHLPQEFLNADKETCELSLKAINEFMEDDDLPYVRGFKAPQWLYNEDLVKVLNKKKWWMAVDRNQPSAPRTKTFYEYNLSIDENFWTSPEEVWKLHGHMGGPSENNMEDCFLNLLKIPLDAEFFYVTDYLSKC
jgi:predicted deacetylase